MGGPSSLARSARADLVRGVWFPNGFAAGENRSYPDYWVIPGDAQYPGYKTLIVSTLDKQPKHAPKPKKISSHVLL
jgi:hypothetical protein